MFGHIKSCCVWNFSSVLCIQFHCHTHSSHPEVQLLEKMGKPFIPTIVGDDEHRPRLEVYTAPFDFCAKGSLVGESVDVADLPFRASGEFVAENNRLIVIPIPPFRILRSRVVPLYVQILESLADLGGCANPGGTFNNEDFDVFAHGCDRACLV